MKIGGDVTTVDVSADGEVVETSRTELSTQINERSVENLPINRRDFSRFALLTPGVSIVQGPDGDEITINGQKGIQNNISIDGADANNPFFGEQRGGQRPAFTISLESVKEFQVVPVGASAEFGRSIGRIYQCRYEIGNKRIFGRGVSFLPQPKSFEPKSRRGRGGTSDRRFPQLSIRRQCRRTDQKRQSIFLCRLRTQ